MRCDACPPQSPRAAVTHRIGRVKLCEPHAMVAGTMLQADPTLTDRDVLAGLEPDPGPVLVGLQRKRRRAIAARLSAAAVVLAAVLAAVLALVLAVT